MKIISILKILSSHLNELLEAYKLLQNIEDAHWKTQKTKELKAIIEMCAGLYLEASANQSSVTLNQQATINIEAINRSNQNILLESITNGDGKLISKDIELKNNDSEKFDIDYFISSQENFTSPYWLIKKEH